jgi:hypothetical protein
MRTCRRVVLPGLAVLLLVPVTAALIPEEASAGPTCTDHSCPAGHECIDGGCQAANHPGSTRFTGALPMHTDCAYGSSDCNVCVDDVRARFAEIRDGFDTSASLYSFRWEDACSKGAPSSCFASNMTTWKWHFQSLQRFAESPTDGSWLVTTRSVDNGPGRFGVIRMGSFNGSTLPWRGESSQVEKNKLVSWVPVGRLQNGFLNHASGAQMLGKVFFTGVECFNDPSCANRKAIVRIVDLSTPSSPVQKAFIELDRGGADAAAARLKDGYLIMTHSDDGGNEKLYFYRSDKLETGWTRIGVWNPSLLTGIDKNFGCRTQSYQNLNLVTQCDGKVFFVGMCRDGILTSDPDWADLYRIDGFTYDEKLGHSIPSITKVAKKKVGTENGASFRYGGGVYVDARHRMSLYATEATTTSDDFSVHINEFAAPK